MSLSLSAKTADSSTLGSSKIILFVLAAFWDRLQTLSKIVLQNSSRLHVFVSLRLDFWYLVPAPKPICKRRSAVECIHCSCLLPLMFEMAWTSQPHKLAANTQRQSRDCPTDHTRCQTEKTRDSHAHSTRAVGQDANKRVTPESDDEQQSHRTTDQCSSPFTEYSQLIKYTDLVPFWSQPHI